VSPIVPQFAHFERIRGIEQRCGRHSLSAHDPRLGSVHSRVTSSESRPKNALACYHFVRQCIRKSDYVRSRQFDQSPAKCYKLSTLFSVCRAFSLLAGRPAGRQDRSFLIASPSPVLTSIVRYRVDQGSGPCHGRSV
jgi:hypothetical protein